MLCDAFGDRFEGGVAVDTGCCCVATMSLKTYAPLSTLPDYVG